jgi:ABC-type dipeptide/oligopeptide/nickel transport system ATPase subunit
MRRTKVKEESLKRINRQSILFNERELKAIEHYCERFKINNRSKFMREAIISEVLKKFEENYPTLWEDQQMSLF